MMIRKQYELMILFRVLFVFVISCMRHIKKAMQRSTVWFHAHSEISLCGLVLGV